MNSHVPVMVNEVLTALQPCDTVEVFLDMTLGLAGHSIQVLKTCKNAKIIGFDQDCYARTIAEKNLSPYKGRFEIIADNFRNVEKLADRENWNGASIVFFDLGVSNIQLTNAERGFSFQNDGPLSMKMNEEDSSNSSLSAEEILNTWSIRDLTRIFKIYGEDPHSYRIAKGIVRYRENGGVLKTTGELVELLRNILPAPVQRKMGGHPARKIFQALRIAVNDEINALDEALDGALKVLAPEGKIIVISYHSLEDRMVKHRFKKWEEEYLGILDPRRILKPTKDEIEVNNKSRSAKMRVFKRITEEGGVLNVLQRMPT